MIEIKNLHKSYRRGKEIIPDLNLSFGETGLTMIVGKSGCGKTTLLNIIGSMDMDFEGQVIIDGQDLKEKSYKEIVDYRNFTSAFVFQKNSLFEFLTVEENLKLCMNIQNNTADISEALERVGLKGFEHKLVKSLSGGEKQRVAIARALIKNCKIIFADEPTSALDTKNAHKIFQLFKDISKDKLVILVTHDLKKAVLYADRIVRFVDGVPVDDTTYNQVTNEAKILPERKTKKFALVPIFKNHLKKGFTINIFLILLLIAAITVANIAVAGIKVKDEYDYYGTDEQVEFNVDRAITTQIANNINLYNVVKNDGATSAYDYLENGLPGNTRLNDVDSLILSNELKDYNIHLGTNDSLNEKLAINGISKLQTMAGDRSLNDGIVPYWEKVAKTNYNYYLYNKNNNYNLIEGGRLPNTENKNEILVSDVVAWHYLCNESGDFKEDYKNPEAYKGIYETDFVIYDINGSIMVGYDEYFDGTFASYKVVGVIKTGLLDFFEFDRDQNRYVFNPLFKNQDNDRYAIFMNSVQSQPYGYVVLQEPLNNGVNNPFYYNSIKMDGINMQVDDVKYELTNSNINTFIGEYDYSVNVAEMYYRHQYGSNGTHPQYKFAGYVDNLRIDRMGRLIALSTSEEELKDNEIILSVELAKSLFPTMDFSDNNKIKESFVSLANKEITIEYNDGQKLNKKTVKIVGISNQNKLNGLFYVSKDLYKEMYNQRHGQSETMTVDLSNQTLKERKAIMERLFELGYSLVPIDIMPGAYLEFVDGHGETYAEVDGEGLKALYPDSEIVTIDGTDYFVNEGVTYGFVEVTRNNDGEIVSIDTVYMTSTIIKRIVLDESYITKNLGNLSPYYLFSEYYTLEEADSGNYILEIMSSMYTFLLGMAVVLALGFIYLKENKERDTMTKLSMLGVRPAHIYLIHFITYLVLSIVIAIGSLVCTYFMVNLINGMFVYSIGEVDGVKSFVHSVIDGGPAIYRMRLMFEVEAFYITGIITLGFFVLSLISSILVTFKSRK